MNLKRFFFGSVVAGAALALTRGLFAATGSAGPSPNSTAYDAIDAYVERQMRRLKIPGAMLAIVEGDKIVHRRSFGWARPGGEAPTPQTPFFIGSLTKSITALAVMKLVEEQGTHVDEVIRGSGLDAGKVNAILVGLQIKRLARLLPGNIVARRAGV